MPKILEPRLAPGDQAWARQVNEREANAEREIERLRTDLSASSKGLAAALAALSKQVNALPILVSQSTSESPIRANSSNWRTVASVDLWVPEEKGKADITLVGSVALLDTVTGGVAAPPAARFLVLGRNLPIENGVPAAKDSGASQVNNVITLGASAQVFNDEENPFGTSITVALQVSVFHSTAYNTASPSNFATLSAQAIFSN